MPQAARPGEVWQPSDATVCGPLLVSDNLNEFRAAHPRAQRSSETNDLLPSISLGDELAASASLSDAHLRCVMENPAATLWEKLNCAEELARRNYTTVFLRDADTQHYLFRIAVEQVPGTSDRRIQIFKTDTELREHLVLAAINKNGTYVPDKVRTGSASFFAKPCMQPAPPDFSRIY